MLGIVVPGTSTGIVNTVVCRSQVVAVDLYRICNSSNASDQRLHLMVMVQCPLVQDNF
jgi:hypothetical protein